MPRTLLLALSILLGLSSVAAAQDFDAAGEAAMLDRINALRVDAELAPLTRVDTLDAVARAHSSEMARTRQLAHVSDATGTPEDRVRSAGVEAGRITENVANHQATDGAQQALEASAPHQANMLDPNVTQVGIGSVRTEQGVFVTQVFTDAPAVAPPEAAPEPPAAPEPTLDDEAPAADPFALIPPFVEHAQEAAAPLLGAMTGGSEAPAEAPEAAEEAPAADAPAAPEAESAPATPVAPQASAPAASAGSLSPTAQNTLRELVGLAQGLLGAAPAQ